MTRFEPFFARQRVFRSRLSVKHNQGLPKTEKSASIDEIACFRWLGNYQKWFMTLRK
jgi:hypothetical protein